jgi:MFS family permease
MWLGAGVIGGIGLGLAYISPVSTLLKWFPDRRGLATGMAIMGFGGGAMIGAPLADLLMQSFATTRSVGVWQTLLVLAAVYFIYMLCGAFGYRLPPTGWRPAGYAPPAGSAFDQMFVPVHSAWRTRQFWLLWIVLCVNVTAGIGVLGMASPLLQEVFGGQLIGISGRVAEMEPHQKGAVTAIAAGFTGLLSLFNIAGRFFWAALSDTIGRKATYATFFLLGISLYLTVAWAMQQTSLGFFVTALCIILSMYGGGFATVPAYLADLFGARMVSAIHGRLLTAWSTAGLLGPVLVNYIREDQLGRGLAASEAYGVTMYVLAALLALGLICNYLIGPVDRRHFIEPGEMLTNVGGADAIEHAGPARSSLVVLAGAWLAVMIPMAWGVWMTLEKAVLLFR